MASTSTTEEMNIVTRFITELTTISSGDDTTTDFETTTESYNNDTDIVNDLNNPQLPIKVFEIFIIVEIVMLAMELMLSIVAAVKMKQWRRNYRNQMLAQISLARFLKRVIAYEIFVEENSEDLTREQPPSLIFLCFIIYFNFVTTLLVFFLVKHMYDTLVVVCVKIKKKNFYKVIVLSWMLPVCLTGSWVGLILFNLVDKWFVDLIFCSLFKWTFTIIGTCLYIAILRKIFKNEIGRYVKTIAIITFLLCLIINTYTITADFARLFRCYELVFVKYVLGFSQNFLVLCLYVVLISTNFKHRIRHCDTLSNYSFGAIQSEVYRHHT